MRFSRIRFFLLLLSLPALSAGAQVLSPLTLDQAVDEAWGHGPDALSARLTWEQDQETYRQAQAQNGFTLAGTTSAGAQAQNQTTSNTLGTTGQTLSGQALSGSLSLAAPSTKLDLTASHQLAQDYGGAILPTTNVGLDLSQQLFDGYPGGKTRGTLEIARLQQEGRRLVWLNARNTILDSVRSAYVALWGAQKAQDAKNAAGTAQQQNAVATRAYFDSKTVTRLDVIQADTTAETARLDALSAGHDVETARGKLNLLLGRPWDSPVTALDPPEHPLTIPARAVVLETAYRHRIEVQQGELDRQSADIDLGLKQAAFYPTVNLTGGVTLKRVWGTVPVNDSGLTGGLGLNFSLWDGGLASSQAVSSQKAVALNTNQRAVARNTVLQDIDAAVFALGDAQARVALAQRTLEENNLALESAQLKFQTGLSARLDVLNALSAQEAAAYQLTLARTTLETAWLTLNKAQGWPP